MTDKVDTAVVAEPEFANRPLWGYADHDSFDHNKRWSFTEALEEINEEMMNNNVSRNDVKRKVVDALMRVISNGGIYIDESKRTPQMVNYHAYGYGCCFDAAYALAVWLDTANKLVVTLEWNKVKGVQERKYGFMGFVKKLLRTYGLWEYEQGAPFSYKAEDCEFLAEMLFSEPEGMTVELWDTPSEIYDITSIDSCMVETDYVKFYDTAPVKGMVVMYKGKAISRNILWTLPDDRRVTGRVYSSSRKANKAIDLYCKENNIERGFKPTDYVIAPFCEYGLPWQDDFSYAIRHNDNIVLFYKKDVANKYLIENKSEIIGGRVYDSRCTSGNNSNLRHRFVECVNGGRLIENEAVVYNGAYYNLANVQHATVDNYYRLKDDDIVRHPYRSSRLIQFSELTLHNGRILLKSDLTEFDGRLVEKLTLRYIISTDANGDYVFTLNEWKDEFGRLETLYLGNYASDLRKKYSLLDGVFVQGEYVDCIAIRRKMIGY